jgi:hypothetical protein
MYTNTGIETLYKGVLDIANNIIITLSEMPRVAKLPILAITKIGTTFLSLATVVGKAFVLMKQNINTQMTMQAQ